MDKWEMAGSILGLLSRAAEAVADAIKAGTAEKEDEAFGVMFGVLSEVAAKVEPFKAALDANRKAAAKALEEKFAAPNPTVLTTDEPTRP